MSETQIQAAARMAAEWWAERLEQGDKAAFIASLQPAIEHGLAENGKILLECEYDPRGPVLDAVRAAGIECRGAFFSADGILPRHHRLIVTPEVLKPIEGYGDWTDPIPVFVAHPSPERSPL